MFLRLNKISLFHSQFLNQMDRPLSFVLFWYKTLKMNGSFDPIKQTIKWNISDFEKTLWTIAENVFNNPNNCNIERNNKKRALRATCSLLLVKFIHLRKKNLIKTKNGRNKYQTRVTSVIFTVLKFTVGYTFVVIIQAPMQLKSCGHSFV